MNKLILGLVLFMLMGAKITTNILQVGRKVAENVTIEFDVGLANNPKIRWANSAGKIQFSNDGTNYFDMGSGSGSGTGGVNLLSANGNFESGTANWTASAGTFDTTTAVGDVIGGQTGRWDAAAAADTLRSDAYTITNDLKGKACLASFQYKCSTCTNGHYSFSVLDGANADVLGEITLQQTTSTQYVQAQAGFVCPSSGSLKFELEAELSAPPEILIDSVHVGSDYRRGVLGDQAELVASATMPEANNCLYQRGVNTFGAFTVDADCADNVTVNGSSLLTIDTTTNDFPRLKINNVPPGRYKVVAKFNAGKSALGDVAFVITDGTTQSGPLGSYLPDGTVKHPYSLEGFFSYTTTANKTFEIYAKSSGIAELNMGPTAGKNGTIEWFVYRFPNQSPRDTVTLETQGSLVSAYISGSTFINLTTADVTTYSDMSDAGLTLTNQNITNSLPVGVACTTPATETQEVGDTTCTGSEGNESAGITFNAPYAGNFEACVQTTWGAQLTAADAFAQTSFRLVETPNNLNTFAGALQTPRPIISVAQEGEAAVTTVHYKTINICAEFYFASAGQKTLRLYYAQDVNSPAAVLMRVEGAGTPGANDAVMTWRVRPSTQQFPQAIALTELDPTKVTSGAAATKMGLKVYLVGTAYTNGTPTITNGNNVTGAGTTVRGVLIPYQMFDGTWRLKVNLAQTGMTSNSANNHALILSGVTFKNLSAYNPVASCHTNQSGGEVGTGLAINNSGNLRCDHATSTPTVFYWSGDVELESKPTWAD